LDEIGLKMIKKVFGVFWAIWGFSCFMIVVAVFTLIYAVILLIGGKKYSRHCVWINCHYLSPLLLFLYGIRLRVHQAERGITEGPCVYISNHLAQIDILANASACPRPMKFLAKAEVRNIPFFGVMVGMLGIIVDRQDKNSRVQSMDSLIRALQEGDNLFIYPEGSRNRTAELLKEFKSGAFRAAVQAQVPIVIQVLINTRELNDPRTISLLPGIIDVYYCEPISTKGLKIEDVPRIQEEAKRKMLQVLTENSPSRS
jgi:1-acyl-sn-glycerol-3-phosphate acyltransferase